MPTDDDTTDTTTTTSAWLEHACGFARVVLPDLLEQLGAGRVGEAFAQLGVLYERCGGDAGLARAEVRNIRPRATTIARNRAQRDAEWRQVEAASGPVEAENPEEDAIPATDTRKIRKPGPGARGD